MTEPIFEIRLRLSNWLKHLAFRIQPKEVTDLANTIEKAFRGDGTGKEPLKYHTGVDFAHEVNGSPFYDKKARNNAGHVAHYSSKTVGRLSKEGVKPVEIKKKIEEIYREKNNNRRVSEMQVSCKFFGYNPSVFG